MQGPSLIGTLPHACGLRSLLGEVAHTPWSVPVVSGRPEVCTLPPPLCFRFGLDTRPQPFKSPRAAGWRGDWSCCCRGMPQSAPEGLFLSDKILLLNPATPYKEGPVLSHSPPLTLDQGLSRPGLNTAQLSTLPNQHPWVYHFVLIPLPVTSSNQVSLGAAQALFGRGGSP